MNEYQRQMDEYRREVEADRPIYEDSEEYQREARAMLADFNTRPPTEEEMTSNWSRNQRMRDLADNDLEREAAFERNFPGESLDAEAARSREENDDQE